MDKVKVPNSWMRTAVIGRGSFGTVSLAVNKSNGALFAVKSVDTNSALPSQIEALENEIGILRSLSSPYVVECLGDDVTVEAPSMTPLRNLHMEYLPGGTVADVARSYTPRGGGADEWIVKNYTFCIVSGLKYLHSQGIVHCDVKGDNVLVGPAPGTAKLADFGSAMEIRPCRKASITPRGTPLWMAPEAVRGEYQGPESDVWSLGCTVIEMVTGKPAWEDKGAADTLCRIGYSDELPRLPTQLSELCRDFVEKCLRRDVSERWSCDQLLQHPFLSMCSPSSDLPTYYWSPRCVLDWFKSDSDEEDEEETPSSGSRISDSDVRGRLGRLAEGRGAIWESDGWVEVRGLASSSSTERGEEVSLPVSEAGRCGRGGEGTSSEYGELMRMEISGAEVGYGDSLGIGEFSRRTSGECLADSDCSAVAEARIDSHHDGVVTDSGRVERPQAGDSDGGCTCPFSALLCLFFYFQPTRRQNLYPIPSFRGIYEKVLLHLLLCKTTAVYHLNFVNFYESLKLPRLPKIYEYPDLQHESNSTNKSDLVQAGGFFVTRSHAFACILLKSSLN
ncbi:mitogen-activated protein kinase kinase kinase 18-like [Coffea arabica]|uniref:Mitogen-activated protein kinase kinase kinase 18-like n=1 Tax=Coffea arabica TaxID=13443 RepID=A0ABM4WUX5_COFAR